MDATYVPKHIPDRIKVRDDIIGGFYFRIAQVLPIYETASQYTGPVMLLHGDHDTVVDPMASKRYHDVYQKSTLYIQKDADHRFMEPYTKETAKVAVDFIKEL